MQKRLTSHPQCNQRLGRTVMTLHPGFVHHTYQKKSLSGFKHYILVEILNISYQILLFYLRNNLPLLLWNVGTSVVSENRRSLGSLVEEIAAVTVFRVKMFKCPWPGRAFLMFTRRWESGGWRQMDRLAKSSFGRKLKIKFLFYRMKEKDILQPQHSWMGDALSLQHPLKL